MDSEFATVYVQLLDEGTKVYRPTLGKFIEDKTFYLLPTDSYNPEFEHWEFPPGSYVYCEKQYGRDFWTAIGSADDKFFSDLQE